MLKKVKEGSFYKNVFTKDRVKVLKIEDDMVTYKKDVPNVMFSCFLKNERDAYLPSLGETVKVGRVIETKRCQQITNKKTKQLIDNVVSEFVKPLRVFNQTYME